MQGLKRKLVYVSLFEVIAIALTTGLLVLLGHGSTLSGAVAVVISVIAVVWNLVWNYSFEAWEVRQTVKGRSVKRRLVHAIGFEAGLAIMTIPLLAWWLSMSLVEAFWLDVGLLIFFLVYTFIFNWCFDGIFGLPESAL